MNFLLIVSILCANGLITTQADLADFIATAEQAPYASSTGVLYYKITDSPFLAPYQGMLPNTRMAAIDASGTLEEYMLTERIDEYTQKTTLYTSSTGCVVYWGDNESDTEPCTVQ